MELTLETTPREVQAKARAFARDILAPAALARDLNHAFPHDELLALARQGMMGMNVSADYGGSQWGVIAYSLAITELARVDASTAVIVSVNNMVSEVLQEFASPAQRERHIRAMTSGRYKAGSFCLSEPGSGSDAAAMRTRARRTASGWVLQGTKSWITSGSHAGVFLVWAKAELPDGQERISAFLVDPQAPGLSVGRPEDKMGQRGSDTVTLTFEDVELDHEAVLGELGQGFRIAMMALDGGRIGVASLALGLGQAAAQAWRQHLQEHASSPSSSLAALERVEAELDEAWLLIMRAAWMKERALGPFTREASMAKVAATEAATRACELAAQALGPQSLTHGALIERLVRDARVTRIYEGTSEIQRLVIARDLTRRAS